MRRKRLLMMIPELTSGGAQRSFAKLSVSLSKYFDIYIVVFQLDKKPSYQYSGELISLDVRPKGGILSKMIGFFLRIQKVRKLKKNLKIDFSLSFLEGADYINVLSKINEKVILSVRGSKLHDENMIKYYFYLRVLLISILYRWADKIIVVNIGIKRELEEFFKLNRKKISVIGNYYQISEIQTAMVEEKSDSMAKFYLSPVLVISSRLAPEKGLFFLISLFVDLKKENSDLRLVFIGDGPLRKKLVEMCVSNHLKVFQGTDFIVKPDVLFLGEQKNVFKYLYGASLFLMNSSSEGYPNSMAESIICGVPVISSDCPYGPREIIGADLKRSYPTQVPLYCSLGVLLPILNTNFHLPIWKEAVFNALEKYLKSENNRYQISRIKFIRSVNERETISKWLNEIES